MNCNEAHTRWHRRLDQNAKDRELDNHLQVCAACRRYDEEMCVITQVLDQLRQDTEAIGSSTTTTASPRIGSIIRGPWRTAIRSLGAVAAAVAVLVTASVFYPLDRNASRPVVNAKPVAAVHAEISLRGRSATTFMAVAETTSDPNVQVFRLYPLLAVNTDVAP